MAWKRDSVILALRGPFTIADVAHLFTGYEKARVRIQKLVAKKRLKYLGRVQLRAWEGKPVRVFSVPTEVPKREWLRHDLLLWQFLRTLPRATMTAGQECDPAIRPDAEVIFSTEFRAFIEMDCETESLQQVGGRWETLATRDWPVLWITLSSERIQHLKFRARQHAIADRIFFALWYEHLWHPGSAWEDCTGRKGRLYPLGG